jgi:DNA-binding XRE family transcriptional regulator
VFEKVIKIYLNIFDIIKDSSYICCDNLIIIKVCCMTKSELGKRIKDRRKTMSIPQNQLAEYTGLSVVTLSQIERGKANPSFETLNEIFHFLNLELIIGVKNL